MELSVRSTCTEPRFLHRRGWVRGIGPVRAVGCPIRAGAGPIRAWWLRGACHMSEPKTPPPYGRGRPPVYSGSVEVLVDALRRYVDPTGLRRDQAKRLFEYGHDPAGPADRPKLEEHKELLSKP